MLRLLAIAIFASTIGCSPYHLRTPNFLHPGPVGPQRTAAIYHDPYPLDDIGPPVVGGRPNEYQRPVPEVVRGRLMGTAPQLVPSL